MLVLGVGSVSSGNLGIDSRFGVGIFGLVHSAFDVPQLGMDLGVDDWTRLSSEVDCRREERQIVKTQGV